jgi:Zn-dependent protease
VAGWLVVALLVLAGPLLLRRWNAYQTVRRVERSPILQGTYALVSADEVPPGIRAGLAPLATELAAVGFVPAGYLRVIDLLPELARHYGLFVHPGEGAFAMGAFGMVVPPLGPTVDFVTLFADGYWVFTLRGRRHLFLADFTSGRLVDTEAATVAQQWQAHRDAVAAAETAGGARLRRAPAPAELPAFKAARDSEEIAHGVSQGDVLPSDDPRRFRFTAAGARRYLARLQQGQAEGTARPGDVTYLRVPLDEQERQYRHTLQLQEVSKPLSSLPAFVLSAIAFVASMLVFTSWAWVAMLIPVLLFHELGHFVAMRALGHRDARIAFIPFLGAATMTNKRFDKRWHEILVLLAGPLPGIALGLAFYALSRALQRPILLGAAGALLAINVLNLLPLVPFDGGRIVHALVTAGRPRVSLLFKLIAAVAFLVGAIWLKEPVFMLLAAVGGVALLRERQLAALEREIRAQPGFADARTEAERRAVIFATLAPKAWATFGHWFQTVRALEVPLGHAKPARLTAVLAGVLYVAGFVAAGAGIARALVGQAPDYMRCPPRARAQAVACDTASGGIVWQPVEPMPARPTPRRPRPPSSYATAAFIWCDFDDKDAARALVDRLSEATLVDDYCAAYPWEPAPDDAEERRRTAARASLRKVSEAALESEGDSPQPTVAALLTRDPTIDREIARLYLAATEPPPDADAQSIDTAHEALADRLGRPTDQRCERVQVSDVALDPTGHADETPHLHFGVRFAAPSDFAPLARYLCSAGCRPQLLPAEPSDLRLDVCF